MTQPGRRISEYVLLEKIGEGGFGEVWKARHHVLNDVVAVKIPTDATYVDQLRNEGTIQRALRHPNIVQTIGLDPAADPPYFVMEFVEGGNLRQRLRGGPLPLQEAVDLARQILEALAFAHEYGVVHRDLKPENVLLAPGGDGARYRVKVADFGLGRAVELVATSLHLSGRYSTSEGKAISGTLDYMAPEQKKGAPADAKSDLYAFGLVLYEMLTGELPVGAFRYPSEIFPDIPRGIDEVLRKCLAAAPADRFANAAEVRQGLESAVGSDFLPAESGIEFRRGEPYLLRNGREVFSLRELVEVILSNWDDGRHEVFDERLEPWLRHLREKDLARRVEEIRHGETDADVGVQKFLDASGLVPPPRMDLDVLELKIGEVPRGSSHPFRIYATRFGRGILWGEARVEGEPAWVQPSRTFFKGAENTVEFTIATSGFRAGDRLDFAVLFESNGGRARVPVHVTVAPRPAHLVCAARDVEIVCRKTGSATVRLRNEGDQPLAVSASWSEEWLSVETLKDLPPGGEESVRIVAKPEGRWEGLRTGFVTLLSNGGTAEIAVRAVQIRRFSFFKFALGLVTGIVPVVAELFLILVLFEVWFGAKDAREGRDNLSFLLGLLPGVGWHGWMIAGHFL